MVFMLARKLLCYKRAFPGYPYGIARSLSESTPSLVLQPEPSANADLLTELLRSGARRLIAQAVKAELETFLEKHAGRLFDRVHLLDGEASQRQEEKLRVPGDDPDDDVQVA
jgi:hypothetical protein